MPALTDERMQALHKSFRGAYLVAILLCVCWPLILQLLLGSLVAPGKNAPSGVYLQLGYTFTLLSVAIAAFLTWRSQGMLKAFGSLSASDQSRTMVREILFYAVLCELCCFFGLSYWALVGEQAARHSRAFIVLTSVMFFVFIPRFDAWRQAAEDPS